MTVTPLRPGRGHLARFVVRVTVTCLLLNVVYFGFPVPGGDGSISTREVLIGAFVAGSGMLGFLIMLVRQIRVDASSPDRPYRSTERLLTVLYVSVLFFATIYYWLSISDPREFSSLETRIDALYFTVVTMSTVGFGDVNATGQVARAFVTVQILFNLVYLGAAAQLVVRAIRRGNELRVQTAAEQVGRSDMPGAPRRSETDAQDIEGQEVPPP